jgi:hypothetical protein
MQNVKKVTHLLLLMQGKHTEAFDAQSTGNKWYDTRRLLSFQKETNALFTIIIEMT